MNPADNQNSQNLGTSPAMDASNPQTTPPVGFPQPDDQQPSVSPLTPTPTETPQAPEAPGSAISSATIPDLSAQTTAPTAQNSSVLDPSANAPQDTAQSQPEIITTSSNAGGGGGKKKVVAGVVVLMMLLGIGAGVFAIRNRQLGSASAWDCSSYTFNVDQSGTVTVQNGSSRNEPPQKAEVYVNGSLVETFDVPRLDRGEGTTLGTISVPTNQSYTWRVDGTLDCEDSGSYQVSEVTAECSAVIAYDENFSQLTAQQLSALSEGDTVFFGVSGTASSGTFDMARFSINGATAIESSQAGPGANEFVYQYSIPASEFNFNVTAEIHHSELGWF